MECTLYEMFSSHSVSRHYRHSLLQMGARKKVHETNISTEIMAECISGTDLFIVEDRSNVVIWNNANAEIYFAEYKHEEKNNKIRHNHAHPIRFETNWWMENCVWSTRSDKYLWTWSALSWNSMAISFRPIEMVTSNGKWYGDFFAEALLVQFYVFYVLRFLFTYSGYGLRVLV